MCCVEFETSSSSLRDAFVSIMTKGTKNNTYKFALARFLLDYCRGSRPESNVRYTRIAKSFFDYYWMQECKARLQQGPSNQRPRVIQIIRNAFKHEYYPETLAEIKKKNPDDVKICIRDITKKCFADVVPRFEEDAERYFGKPQGGRSYKRIFYDYLSKEYHDLAGNHKIDPGGGIKINPHAIKFLKENYEPLFRTVILEWIKFLEKRNIGMPRMAEKISGNVLGPRGQTKFKKKLEPFADRCFYCNVQLVQGRCTHVDHVLPYDYVGDTDMWNLVLACKDCNCSKSGGLPPKRYITKLKERNCQYKDQIIQLEKSLDMFDNGPDIDWHYNNASKHGYPPWIGPDRNRSATHT